MQHSKFSITQYTKVESVVFDESIDGSPILPPLDQSSRLHNETEHIIKPFSAPSSVLYSRPASFPDPDPK